MDPYYPSKLDGFYDTGPKTVKDAFPPACLRTHWDPTMVVKHVLPDFYVSQALDPRPASKICFAYHHASAGDAPLPTEAPPTVPPTPPQFLGGLQRPPPTVGGKVFPPGGRPDLGFPFAGYRPGVETDLFRIDERLTRCAEKRYVPPAGVPVAEDSTNVIPGSRPIQAPEVLSGPHAGCREADDRAAWLRSDRLYFNPTRYDRTTTIPVDLKKASSRHALPYPNTASF